MSIEYLAELLAHEEVGLEFILFFEKHIPQLVEFIVRFEAKFVGSPRTASLGLLTRIHHIACELHKIL